MQFCLMLSAGVLLQESFFIFYPGYICHVLQLNAPKHFVLDFTIFIFRTLIGFWSLQGISMHTPRCVVAVLKG